MCCHSGISLLFLSLCLWLFVCHVTVSEKGAAVLFQGRVTDWTITSVSSDWVSITCFAVNSKLVPFSLAVPVGLGAG